MNFKYFLFLSTLPFHNYKYYCLNKESVLSLNKYHNDLFRAFNHYSRFDFL